MTDIYFDNAATTAVLPCAYEAMVAAARDEYGNPSSVHRLGQAAKAKKEKAIQSVKGSLGQRGGRVIFTGSGTEANNLALIGRAYAKDRYRGGKIIITDSEHPSVTETARHLENMGYRCALVPTAGGRVDTEALKRELSSDVFLVSVMTANNETGAVYDIREVARLTRELCPEAAVHTDATQAWMKLPASLYAPYADMITVSGHKIGAPKGIGVLWVKDELIVKKGLSPIVFGGGQQEGLRSGTENMPGIAALAAAADCRMATPAADVAHMTELRAYIIDKLKGTEVQINSAPHPLPHILSLTLPSIKSETMLNHLSAGGVYVSAGSACSSSSARSHGSPALTAYGLSDKEAQSTLRVSLCPANTKEEADIFISLLLQGVNTLVRSKK